MTSKEFSLFPRESFAMISYMDNIYVLGGKNNEKSLKYVFSYNPSNEQMWQKSNSEMITARSNFATVIYDGQIYAIGGYNDQRLLKTYEKYQDYEKYLEVCY